MSEDSMPVNAQAGETVTLPSLSPLERRILGVLIEKAKTTPDNYPMTLNSLITGCNQKSNREPVMDVSDAEIEEVVPRLKQLGLMQQILGSGRTDKFRHCLYDAWRIDKQQIAIIGELLLRGAQSEGDLRGRASRMEPFADLDALRPVVKTLSERGMVIYLTPEGRRGTMVTHGFHTADELQLVKARAERFAMDDPIAPTGITSTAKSSGLETRVLQLEQAVTDLKEQVASLREQLSRSNQH